jgi:hypothetical protein
MKIERVGREVVLILESEEDESIMKREKEKRSRAAYQ